MATSIAITITPTRALTVEGRLVAGETAEVTIGGATPTALYLVAPNQTVVAACEAFTPTGQGSGGVGFLQLATEQVAALFANTPAGRMVAVWALVNNADGVAGAGWIPVVSAPMPDELVDLDIDFYLRASQVGAGLAIVDGKLVCTVNPDTYLMKTEAAATYATQTELAATRDVADHAEGAAQSAIDQLSSLKAVAYTGSYNDLTDKPTIPTVPVQSVNGQTGEVVLTASDVEAAPAADLRYAIGATITASATLADRTGNRVIPAADNTYDIRLGFPQLVEGYLLDFEVLVTYTPGNTGRIIFEEGIRDTVYGDGFKNAPASGETWLYVITQVGYNSNGGDRFFWAKSEKMEVVS